VNDWCSQNTKGRITNIIDDINFDTLLISAIHFKGFWENSFSKLATSDEDFKLFSGETKKVSMMTKRFKHLAYVQTPAAQIVILPYRDTTIRARIILPR